MPLPKKLELRIRSLVERVHAQHLAESLAPVEQALRDWREGKTTVFAVDEAIRQHQMRSKRFYLLYPNVAATSPEVLFVLDEALKLGFITKEEHRELSTFRRK